MHARQLFSLTYCRRLIPVAPAQLPLIVLEHGCDLIAPGHVHRPADVRLQVRMVRRGLDANPLLKQFRPQLLIDITSEGLRIQIVDSQKRPMFNLSSATVEPYMRVILREILPKARLHDS